MIISLANINWGGGSGGGGGTVVVIDNLESTATTAALSANQGKVLGDHIGDAEEVVARAFQSFNSSLPSNYLQKGSVGFSDWNSFTYYNDGLYDVSLNGVDSGKRLHVMGAGTEFSNPRVDQITTSESVLRIVTLTQDEYDALELAGTLNNNTLYAIIPSVV